MDTESLNERLQHSKSLLDELSKRLFTTSECVFVGWVALDHPRSIMDMYIRTESRKLLATAVKEHTFLAECAEKIAAAAEAANDIRRRLLARTNLLHNEKTPSVSLPLELIATFLQQGLPDWPNDDPFTMPRNNTRYLVTITSVCHKWREAAWNAPRLWALVECTILPGRQYFEYVRHQLSSSGRLLLAIDVREKCWMIDEYPDVDAPLALISTHIHRIQRLNIDISSSVYPEFSQLLSGNLPRLSHMHLCVRHDYSEEDIDPFPPISPPESLKYVRLTYEAGSTPIAKHSSMLASNAVFLYVTLHEGLRRDLSRILRNAPVVEELVIQWMGDEDDPHLNGDVEQIPMISPQDRVTLSRLRLLMCASDPDVDFSWIDRPALQTFCQVEWGSWAHRTMVPSEHVGTFYLNH